MGEYILLDKQPVKLGTCEDLFYVRYDMLRRWIAQGRAEYHPGNAQPAHYLEGAYRFRFPFPDEDEAANRDDLWLDFDRGVVVKAPLDWMAEHADHQIFTQAVGARFRSNPREDLPHLNVPIPCPQGANFAYGQFFRLGYHYVEVLEQRPFDGRLWVVCRCPWCGWLYRVPPTEAAQLAEAIAQNHAGDALRLEIARRMMDGYETETDSPKQEG